MGLKSGTVGVEFLYGADLRGEERELVRMFLAQVKKHPEANFLELRFIKDEFFSDTSAEK